ncbi:MAG TPA: AAA family ATPase [Ktedonobacterales bacterium]
MPEDTEATFGALLRKFRLERGFTQKELALQAKLGANTIAEIERGVSRALMLDNAEAIADALQLNPEERDTFMKARERAARRAPRGGRGAPARNRAPPKTRPLIGRGAEQERIGAWLTGAGPPMLIIEGQPGVGKSRLLKDVMARARVAGWQVLYGGAYQQAGQHPYAPVVQALDRYMAGLARPVRRRQIKGAEWMARMLPELAEIAPIPELAWKLPPEHERRLMFDATRRFLVRVATPGGALLALDDIQWATPDSLSLLMELLQAAEELGGRTRLRVLATLRDTDTRANQSLSDFTSRSSRDGLLTVMRLDPLEAASSGALMAQELAARNIIIDEHDDDIQSIVRRASGVPLYLLSLAREIRMDSTGRVVLPSPDLIPQDIAEIARQRMSALPPQVEEVLALAAVYGRETPESLLATTCGQPDRRFVEAVETLCSARLLYETEEAGCRFYHDLFREAVLANLSGARTRLYHREIAEALELNPAPGQSSLLAYHYAQGGDSRKALIYHERAGDEALALRAYVGAELQFRDALRYAEELQDAAAGGRVWDKLGLLFMGRGVYGDAIAAIEQAIASYERIPDRDSAAQSIAQFGWAHALSGTGEQGLARVEHSLTHMTGLSSRTQAALYRANAILMFSLNRYVNQLASARRAVALAREASDRSELARGLRLEGLALALLGEFDEALPALSETRAVAQEVGDLESYSAALNDTAAVCRSQGNLRQCANLSAESLAIAVQVGDTMMSAFFNACLGDAEFLLGHWREARRRHEQALEISSRMSVSWVTAYPLLLMGQLNLAEGHDSDADEQLREAFARATEINDHQALRLIAPLLAERDLLRSRPSAALQWLLPLVEPTTVDEKDMNALLPTVAWARLELGDQDRAVTALDACVRRAKATGARMELVDAYLAQARVSTRRCDMLGGEDALGNALDLARAMEYPYGELKAHYLAGALYEARGSYVAARSRYELALAICEQLGERLYARHIESALAQLSGA